MLSHNAAYTWLPNQVNRWSCKLKSSARPWQARHIFSMYDFYSSHSLQTDYSGDKITELSKRGRKKGIKEKEKKTHVYSVALSTALTSQNNDDWTTTQENVNTLIQRCQFFKTASNNEEIKACFQLKNLALQLLTFCKVCALKFVAVWVTLGCFRGKDAQFWTPLIKKHRVVERMVTWIGLCVFACEC